MLSNKSDRSFCLALACAALTFAAPAHAGANCETTVPKPEKVADAFDSAMELRSWLDTQNPKVAVIARRGQNLDEYGLRYSHAGFAVRNEQSGTWTVVHLLNSCGTDRSTLYEQGLSEFFSDDLVSNEVVVSIPVVELQLELVKALAPQNRFRMHHPRYNAVAYPYATKYQNSNGWLLETFAAAVGKGDITTRQQAQEVLKTYNYVADVMTIRPLKRLGAKTFKANIEFDDHPGEQRWSNKIAAHTGDSTMRFVNQWGMKIEGCTKSSLASAVCVLK